MSPTYLRGMISNSCLSMPMCLSIIRGLSVSSRRRQSCVVEEHFMGLVGRFLARKMSDDRLKEIMTIVDQIKVVATLSISK